MKIAMSRRIVLGTSWGKIALSMKLFAICMLAACIQVSARGYGQKKITLQLKSANLKQALHQLEKAEGVRFLYNDALIGDNQKVNVDAKNEALTKVLDELFAGTSISYKIMDDDLVVLSGTGNDDKDNPVQVVKGKVTGSNGEIVAGASVLIKGTKNGTSTNAKGDYTISADEGAVLVFSFVGYDDVEKTVGSSGQIDVVLPSSTKALDQVVVVGYGTQRKIDVTGSVAQIKGDAIAKQGVVNPVSGLQGKVAGVQITNTGEPGASPDIKIRGLGTYSSNAAPLYVVDGVWVSDLSFLNSADIENISVLKDASSESIYGVRGANGVVIVTTKAGSKKGKIAVNYNGSIGFQVANHIPKMVNGTEYATLFNELTRASGGTSFLDSSKYGASTNWFDLEMRNAIISNHQVSVNGGNDKSTFNLSLGYLGQQGLLKTNSYDRYTASFKNDIQVSKNVKVGYIVIGTYSKSHDVPGSIWRQLYTAPPVLPAKNPDGTYGNPVTVGLGPTITNPQVSMDYNNATTQKYHVNGSAYMDIKFAKNFTLHSSVGGIYDQNQTKNFTPIYNASPNQQSSNNTLTLVDYSTRNWIVENTLTYNNKWGDHRLTAMVGQTAFRNFYGEVHSSVQNGSLSSDPNTWYLGLGNQGTLNVYDVTPSANGAQTYPALERVSSYLSRVTYSYKDRYTVTGTLRSDASTKFTTNFGRAYLPSVGAAWIVSNEDFMKNQHIFNSLKLKGSWGQVGNSGIPAYIATQTTYSGGGVIFGNGSLLSGQSIASPVPPALNWEKGEGTDIAIEAAFLGNRLNVEADYYNKNTTNFIFPVLYLGSNGFTTSSLPQNVGKLRNNGVELSINWHDNPSKDFSYSIGGNLAYNTNKFISNFAGGQKLYSGGGASTGGQLGTVTTVGQPVGEFYGYQVIGIFQTAAEVAAYTDKNGTQYQSGALPGDFKYASTTGVGPIGGNDRVALGNPNPKYIYGINTTWAYKAFDLGLDFNGVAGVQVYNANKGLRYGNENFTQDFYDNRWHGAGTSNAYPSVRLGGGQNYYVNSWYVESGSYFRIRNVQLGYTLPDNLLQKWGMQKLRIYANAQNPVIFTKYKGFSPEVGGTPGNVGIDNNVYPISAVYNLGVNLTF